MSQWLELIFFFRRINWFRRRLSVRHGCPQQWHVRKQRQLQLLRLVYYSSKHPLCQGSEVCTLQTFGGHIDYEQFYPIGDLVPQGFQVMFWLTFSPDRGVIKLCTWNQISGRHLSELEVSTTSETPMYPLNVPWEWPDCGEMKRLTLKVV